MASDEQLIAAIREGGNPAALGELVERHLGKVRSMVFSMVLDDAAADDVTQEVFLRAIRGLFGFDGRSKFSTWLFRIAKNTSLTWLERQSRMRVSAPVEAVDGADRVALAPAPERALLAQELWADVEAALEELSPALRAAVVLTSLEGYTPAAAAEIEECSTSTMYWRIHEARKQLRGRLKEHLS